MPLKPVIKVKKSGVVLSKKKTTSVKSKPKKPAPKPAPKPTPKPAPKPTPKPAPKPTPKPALKPTPKPAPKSAPIPASIPAPKLVPIPASIPVPIPAPKLAPKPVPKPIPISASIPVPIPAPKPAPIPDPKPDPKPDPIPILKPVSPIAILSIQLPPSDDDTHDRWESDGEDSDTEYVKMSKPAAVPTTIDETDEKIPHSDLSPKTYNSQSLEELMSLIRSDANKDLKITLVIPFDYYDDEELEITKKTMTHYKNLITNAQNISFDILFVGSNDEATTLALTYFDQNNYVEYSKKITSLRDVDRKYLFSVMQAKKFNPQVVILIENGVLLPLEYFERIKATYKREPLFFGLSNDTGVNFYNIHNNESFLWNGKIKNKLTCGLAVGWTSEYLDIKHWNINFYKSADLLYAEKKAGKRASIISISLPEDKLQCWSLQCDLDTKGKRTHDLLRVYYWYRSEFKKGISSINTKQLSDFIEYYEKV